MCVCVRVCMSVYICKYKCVHVCDNACMYVNLCMSDKGPKCTAGTVPHPNVPHSVLQLEQNRRLVGLQVAYSSLSTGKRSREREGAGGERGSREGELRRSVRIA